MKISENMSTTDLADRMGGTATPAEATAMRDLLVAEFDGVDTSDVEALRWCQMLSQSVALARLKPTARFAGQHSHEVIQMSLMENVSEGYEVCDGRRVEAIAKTLMSEFYGREISPEAEAPTLRGLALKGDPRSIHCCRVAAVIVNYLREELE